VTDLWEEFSHRAGDAEVAGYFERSGVPGGRPGLCVSFLGADAVLTLTPATDLAAIAETSRRFLHRSVRTAVIGYAGFDAVGLFEPALRRFPRGSPFPLGEFALISEARFDRPKPHRVPRAGGTTILRSLDDSLPRDRYIASVRHLRQAIRNGEAYQVVLAHRRTWIRPPDLLTLAERLRASERYAYFYYLRFGDRELLGASPESVVEVDGRRALINPIAGTLPAGAAPRRRLPLKADPKELAEHRMLVDLARNDLGRVAQWGSVHLIRAEQRVRYARLEHLVSRVAARLRPGVGPWEALAATFPAGTVSGAPKIRATELLRREEGTWRGPYSGTVGLIRPGGRADWALAIRSAFAAGDRLYTAAGAGIVYRSQPGREFHETLVKLAHIENTLVGRPT
jgi:anthranilate/para-aminobenzoate synthase component I